MRDRARTPLPTVAPTAVTQLSVKDVTNHLSLNCSAPLNPRTLVRWSGLAMSSSSSNGLPGDTTVLDRSAMSTIQPVIVTAHQDVLLGFYMKLFGAEETFRVPAEGPPFYLGLRIGDTDLGLVAQANAGTGPASRILLSIGVEDVDETLGRVVALGGSVRSGPNDMPWGERVAHISDPDGNPLNITQPIPAR